MKEKLTVFLHGLITYDYILFGGVFLLFIIFIVLAIVLRKKLFFSLFFLLLSFVILFVGPTLGYKELHKYLFKNSVTIESQKKLLFTPAIVLKGILKNESNFDFSECIVRAQIHKASKNKLKNYFYSFKTIKKMSMLETDILKGKSKSFKMIIEPFNYKKKYNISLQASCK